MKKCLFAGVGAAFAALLTQPAMAQKAASPTPAQMSTTSNYNSQTQVEVPIYNLGGNLGGAGSTPSAANAAPDPSGYSPYNTNATIHQDVTRQVPSITAPTVYGLNPCSIGASLGVATPIFGVSGAVTSTDEACEARNNAALAISAFHNEFLAREATCEIKSFRAAWKRIGKPCLVDQPLAMNTSPIGNAPAPLASPAGSSQPVGIVPIPGPAPVIMPSRQSMNFVPASLETPGKPDWCYTASPAELRTNPRVQAACGGA